MAQSCIPLTTKATQTEISMATLCAFTNFFLWLKFSTPLWSSTWSLGTKRWTPVMMGVPEPDHLVGTDKSREIVVR